MQDIEETDFRVGDKVWCVVNGEGVVESDTGGSYSYGCAYPVIVKFENNKIRTYTLTGKLDITHKYRSLFFSEPKVEAKTTRPFKSDLIGRIVVMMKINEAFETSTYVSEVIDEDKENIKLKNGLTLGKKYWTIHVIERTI